MTARNLSWVESLGVGVMVFGVVGTGSFLALLAGLVAYVRTDESLWSTLGLQVPLSAMAAASVVGTLAWRFVVVPSDSARWRGSTAGLIVGIASHPLCWVLFWTNAVAVDRVQLDGVNFAVYLFGMTTVSTFTSLFLSVWLSAPVCALLGFFAADLRRALNRKALRSRQEWESGL